MINYGRVRSTVKPEAVTIDDFSVWQHTDIEEISENIGTEDEFHGYEFTMIQYTKDEFILKQAAQNTELGNLVNTILGVENDG